MSKMKSCYSHFYTVTKRAQPNTMNNNLFPPPTTLLSLNE